MIQRIQSVYLFLTSIMSVLFLTGNFFSLGNSTGNNIYMNFSGIWVSANGSEPLSQGGNYFLTIIFVLIALGSLITVFMYKNRGLQIRMTSILILASVVSAFLTVYYYLSLSAKYDAELISGFRLVIPPVILILCILALLGIRKDENLVRSYDRIR